MSDRSLLPEHPEEDEEAREQRLRKVFDSLDSNGNQKLEIHEMQVALNQLGLPSSKAYVRDLLSQYDLNSDDEIEFAEFKRYIDSKEAGIRKVFRKMDVDHSGHLDACEVYEAVKALGLTVSRPEVDRMIALLDQDGDEVITYDEFRRFVVLLPGAQVSADNILAAWVDSTSWVESMEYRLNHVPPKQPMERLIAGGVAGAVSRTVVAPLERLRTIMMTDKGAVRLGPVLQRMWADGGVRGMFKGNLATVMKVFPSSAIQFAMYDTVKLLMQHNSKEKGSDLSSAQKFTAGLVAGATACSCTYPLESLRTQIQVDKGGGSYLSIMRSALASRGVMGMYQGYGAGLTKDSMTQALGFASYEGLCSGYKHYLNSGEPPSTGTRGVLGGMSAFLVMSATMPLENVMRRLQVQGRPGFERQYSGAIDCIGKMLRTEGVRSFWRGSLSSYAKVVPSIAATRMLYEGLIEFWGIGGVRRYRLASEQSG